MNIIGLVGPIACGKGVVADYLIKEYGYRSFSLSSLVHEELKNRGIKEFTRSTLQDVGDDLRKKEGEGVLAKRAIAQLKAESEKLKAKKNQPRTTNYELRTKIIIEGIRNPGEIEYLRTIPGFFLIAVDAPQRVRFDRILKRAKPWDPTDWESFLNVDRRDAGQDAALHGQQVRACMALADVKIQNDTNSLLTIKGLLSEIFTTRII